MGGVGSGRRYQSGKDSTSDYRNLDVRRLQREGRLTAGQSFQWQWSRRGETVAAIDIKTHADHVILSYRQRRPGEEWQSFEYPVRLTWTPCTLGGERPWFVCPARGCGRRVAVLYKANAYFACRHCHQLVYESQREDTPDRLARRADKIRVRLGWEPGILNSRGSVKPKGMHTRTYLRLLAEYNRLSSASLEGMAAQLGLIEKQLTRVQKKLTDNKR